ncbi:MAG TPA: hypothetical protein VHB99_05265, partial [Pirellulales bacterium]|nr:hypothetical protein [Pirellulales bacterium]
MMHEFQEICRCWLAWITAASWQLALLVCLVAVATRLAAKASPRLRHGLWLLVLVKVFLSPGLTTPVSIGRCVVEPLLKAAGMADLRWPTFAASGRNAATEPAANGHEDRPAFQAASRTAPLARAWNSPAW